MPDSPELASAVEAAQKIILEVDKDIRLAGYGDTAVSGLKARIVSRALLSLVASQREQEARLEEARKALDILLNGSAHLAGCLFLSDRRMPCQCGSVQRLDESYSFARKALAALPATPAWYQAVGDVLEAYKRDHSKDYAVDLCAALDRLAEAMKGKE